MNNIKPFIIKRNDTLPALSINIRSRGDLNEVIPFNLSGVSACTFSMSDSCGSLKVSSSSAEIISASGGTLQYNWGMEDTDTTGKFKGEFELFFDGGAKMSVPTLGYIEIQIGEDVNGS